LREMIACGIDAGLETIKTVLLRGADIIYSAVIPIGANTIADVAEGALSMAIASSGITPDEISGIFVTGVGSPDISFASERFPEALCLAAGIEKLKVSFAGIILDIGAHKSMAIQCKGGLPLKAAYSDRCASSSGIFLELVAQLLGVGITDIGEMALQSKETVTVQSSCAIYAETEIISLLHSQKRPEDILKGVYRGFSARIYPLLANVGYIQGITNLVVTGGIAHNIGMLKAIEERVAGNIWVPENPDILGALGAAIGKR
jgi:(R)-2-hydroxyacyl-CoA dehydratese activating ATPase